MNLTEKEEERLSLALLNKMKKELINLARQSIKAYLEGKHFEPEEKIKKEFSDKKACFVTLTLKGELRGFIGILEARQEL